MPQEEKVPPASAPLAPSPAPSLATAKEPQRAGSFTIRGATGMRAERVNGTFDLTDEVCNGMPVYKKRGSTDADTWMEMVKNDEAAGGWRW